MSWSSSTWLLFLPRLKGDTKEEGETTAPRTILFKYIDSKASFPFLVRQIRGKIWTLLYSWGALQVYNFVTFAFIQRLYRYTITLVSWLVSSWHGREAFIQDLRFLRLNFTSLGKMRNTRTISTRGTISVSCSSIYSLERSQKTRVEKYTQP